MFSILSGKTELCRSAEVCKCVRKHRQMAHGFLLWQVKESIAFAHQVLFNTTPLQLVRTLSNWLRRQFEKRKKEREKIEGSWCDTAVDDTIECRSRKTWRSHPQMSHAAQPICPSPTRPFISDSNNASKEKRKSEASQSITQPVCYSSK